MNLSQEVEKAEQVAMQLIAEQRANMAPISEAPASAVAGGYVPMDVDSGPSPSGGTKRKAEEEASAGDASKKAKTGTSFVDCKRSLVLTHLLRSKALAPQTVCCSLSWSGTMINAVLGTARIARYSWRTCPKARRKTSSKLCSRTCVQFRSDPL